MIRLRNQTKREFGVCGSRAEDQTHPSKSEYQTWWFININETCSSGRGGSWCPMMAVLGMHQTWSRSTVGWRDTSICVVKIVVLIGVPSFQPYPVPPPPTPSTGGGAAKSPLFCIFGAHFKLCHHTHTKASKRQENVTFHTISTSDCKFPNGWALFTMVQTKFIPPNWNNAMQTDFGVHQQIWPWSEHQRWHCNFDFDFN